jgi:L-fuculose-phosphate aldolase
MDPEKQERRLKAEIIQVGRKLWERQYVDGSGGNISARLSADQVICTPAFCSKGDLVPDELAVVDLGGAQQSGSKPPSSEILLHLTIYREIACARSVIHCHPPHGLAYALTGAVPEAGMVPEYEVFIGDVALVPYETPGTPEFAAAAIPYLPGRNLLLLQNHGIVCWADDVKKAEWMVEVFDTYCRAMLLATNLKTPLIPIPEPKLEVLRGLRAKLGLPMTNR